MRVALISDVYATRMEGELLSVEGAVKTIRLDDGSKYRTEGRIERI